MKSEPYKLITVHNQDEWQIWLTSEKSQYSDVCFGCGFTKKEALAHATASLNHLLILIQDETLTSQANYDKVGDYRGNRND